MAHSTFRRIWLPGFLLQSVVIGGGYATGRELVEFFLSTGPLAGLLGMAVATLLLSVTSALAFELARLTRSFDYRSFLQQLLGRAWIAFELAYFLLFLLVLAVVGAATGELAAAHLGLPKSVGTGLLLLSIGVLVFLGSELIEKVLAAWSFVLYAVYGVLVAAYLWRFGGELPGQFAAGPADLEWMHNGLRYFGYNVVGIAVILFCVRHMTSRRDAFAAGALAGPLVMIPGLLFYLALAAAGPEIRDVAVPADFLIRQLGFPWLEVVFYVVVFGTFVETGTAFIHAVNERVSSALQARRRAMPTWLRPVIAAAALLAALVLAERFGIIALIAQGYGTLTWVFIALFIVPLFTIGARTVWRGGPPR